MLHGLMLLSVKSALRLTITDYDAELNLMIGAALADLGLVGIDASKIAVTTTDPLVTQAVITYCRLHFGTPDDYEHLKQSYDEQKAQLISATGYGLPTGDLV